MSLSVVLGESVKPTELFDMVMHVEKNKNVAASNKVLKCPVCSNEFINGCSHHAFCTDHCRWRFDDYIKRIKTKAEKVMSHD